MPGTASLLAFAGAALIILLIPGPGVLYIVARSLSQGYRAGLVSVLGLSAGCLVHVAATTAGLSAILLASANAFTAVKLLGAGYLIYLGLKTLLVSTPRARVEASGHRALRRIFTDGIVVSVFNPKAALFFVAFLPQFVEPARGPVAPQLAFLGLLYVAMALVTDSAYALLAGSMRRWLSSRIMQGPAPRYVSGGLYVGLGVTLALAERR